MIKSARVVIADFCYRLDKRGNSYGWGVARYTTPEQLYNQRFHSAATPPEESYKRMYAHLRQLLPMVSDGQISRLLG